MTMSFSPTRIAAISANTLTDLTRQKVFYVLLIFALVLIGSSVFLARFSFQQEFQILKDISLGTMSIFSSLLAIVATASLIPRDIEDRTVYTILAKPVPRFEYLLGKLFGVLVLLAISLALTGASCGAICVVPSLIALIDVLGFTRALLIAPTVAAAVLVPVTLVWIGAPAVRKDPNGAQAAIAPSEWTRARANRFHRWLISGPPVVDQFRPSGPDLVLAAKLLVPMC